MISTGVVDQRGGVFVRALNKRKWRGHAEAAAGIPIEAKRDGKGDFCFLDVIASSVDQAVLIVLASGAGYNAVAGVIADVFSDHLTLVSGNVITSIPYKYIAALSRLAGGGPVPPVTAR